MTMSTELIVALLAGVVAMASATLAYRGQLRTTRLEAEFASAAESREDERQRRETYRPYLEPLGRAAYDLQSRRYNILEQNLIRVYLIDGDERQSNYVVDNTTFLIAQYFAWTEIVRQEIQFIDLGKEKRTRKLSYLQDDIHSLWQTDRSGRFSPSFLVFAGEQRAIGEKMVVERTNGLTCVGYGTFLAQGGGEAKFLLGPLREDILSLQHDLGLARPRLVALQNALIDLIDFLDPKNKRFPPEKRKKVAA